MKNEIGRKITSLTLMTIMVAGGLTFAVPGMMPAAHAANANLFVSAENSQFDNYMSGPQVIEIVIIDSDINDTDEGEGEPDVTVNGKKIRMTQASDGNWYAYFADRNQAQIADSTATTAGEGTDFGVFCSSAINLGDTDNSPDSTVNVSETVGVALPRPSSVTGNPLVTGSSSGGTITASCTPADGQEGTTKTMNVIRENKSLNLQEPGTSADTLGGQIGLEQAFWPFIQLYTLNPTGNVEIQYNKGGGAQLVTLTFDTVDGFASLELDRAQYPRKAQVHATITDSWLNIDPTDEDSWTFDTAGTTGTFYQVFDENGADAGATSTNTRTGSDTLTAQLGKLMCSGCVMITNPDTQGVGTNVFTLQDNDDSNTEIDGSAQNPNDLQLATNDLLKGERPITIVERGPNSGIFGTYDESDVSVIKITDDAKRGTSATIDYNDSAQTLLVGFDFATIDIQPTDDEWSSGEEIPVVLVDADANKNTRADEDLNLFNPDNTFIPALSTGSPFTLEEDDEFIFFESLRRDSENAFSDGIEVHEDNPVNVQNDDATVTDSNDLFSKRSILTLNDLSLSSSNDDSGDAVNTAALLIDFDGRTIGDLKEVVRLPEANKDVPGDDPATDFNGFSYFNWDIRTFDENLIDAGHSVLQTDIYLVSADTTDLNADTVFQNVDESCLLPIAIDADLQGRQRLTQSHYDFIYGDGSETGATGDDCDLVASTNTNQVGVLFALDDLDTDIAIALVSNTQALTADFTTFGFTNDGTQGADRIADQIIRLELEENGDNTNTFEGGLEYFMVNQLNIVDGNLYDGLSPISDVPSFIAMEDLTDEDSPRVNYLDLGADGVETQIADQQAAPSHSGTVSLDSNSYKIADTVTVTLEDADLNVDSELIDIFTGVDDLTEEAFGTIGAEGQLNGEVFDFGPLGRLLDVTFDNKRWAVNPADVCVTDNSIGLTAEGVGDISLVASGFTLVETGTETGVFTGSFQVPKLFCNPTDLTLDDDGDGTTTTGGDTDDDGFTWAATPLPTTGKDIEVHYVDFRDASGEIIEVGDSAAISANTGSVSLDRTVYPVPFGVPANFDTADQTAPDGDSIFAIHASGINDDDLNTSGTFLPNGDLTIHVRVNDPDFDVSASGEDTIARNVGGEDRGPVKISVIRGSESVVLGYAGNAGGVIPGVIAVNDDGDTIGGAFRTDGGASSGTIDGTIDATDPVVRQFGAMTEVAPDAGIFEADITLRYTDGPDSTTCPTTRTNGFTAIDGGGDTETDRFADTSASNENYCILQGDILQVEYFDPEDASGNSNTVTDSATFDLRNGVLQSDKSVYIIGSDMILTLIEPDLDLDNDQAETYDLDLIEWDSDAATVTMGNRDGEGAAFDPEPSNFRETGDSTGIFQVVVEIPETLENDRLERGEEIVLEYSDWGPSGADYVGDEEQDINLTIYTSNFGATVELDQKVYTWTDKVYITIVAPDHNFDSNTVDSVGEQDTDPIKISTRSFNIDSYELVETGTDTGIFTGEVILTGFDHDASGDGKKPPRFLQTDDGNGPTDGLIGASDDDGLTVSFEFSEDETVVGSALIRWNIGEVQWLEASYPATGTGVVRVIDQDMNLDPEAVDNFTANVWSDSDSGGVNLTVTETNEATGIFEGTVFFTVDNESSGHRLRVAEGDTVTAEYEDNTLPDPYTTADELDITATTLIGTIVPPLERAPAANLRTVDAFGNSLNTISVDQQVQITADLANGQDREQPFAYLVQIQDESGVTVSLAWITGSLSAGQSFSPAVSWIPIESGTYSATAFVWESVDNPTALSPPLTITINVQ